MISDNNELLAIITKFAESGWDLIDGPSKIWLQMNNTEEISEDITSQLVTAIETADEQCGSCGCEFDLLYKRVLILLEN